MNESYDIIVVGGGPAGLMAARHAAERGVSVLLLEKDRQIGLPVRCAEGVSEKGLREIIQVRERWISRCIDGIKLVAPDGTEFKAYSDDRGFILNRSLFEADLAEMAARAGAQIRTKSYVKGLIFQGDQVRGVIVEHLGFSFRINAKLVIGADGVESRIGCWSGVLTTTSPEDLQSCVQMTCTGIEFDPDVVTLLYGRKIAPDGYLWIFPKSENTANVGVTISGAQTLKKKPLYFLREYIESRYPLATVTNIVAGCYSAGPALKKFVKDSVMLIGDAAHQTNPLTGGGIINAMIAGEMAGRIGAEAVKAGDISEKVLSIYPKEWKRIGDRDVSLAYRVKKVVDGFDDMRLDEIAHTLVQLPQEKRTPINILKTAFIKHPKLVLEAARMFV